MAEMRMPAKSNPVLQGRMRDLIALAIELYQPTKIIAFGSQVTGSWRSDSDFDFMIVEPSIKQPAGALHVEAFKRRIRIKFDVVVALQKTIDENILNTESVHSRALNEGETVFEK